MSATEQRLASRPADTWGEYYSPRNQMILAVAGATEVAGYREWQALGRQVRKGEHAIALGAPVVVKDKETGQPKVVNMRTVSVFDISQTDEISL